MEACGGNKNEKTRRKAREAMKEDHEAMDRANVMRRVEGTMEKEHVMRRMMLKMRRRNEGKEESEEDGDGRGGS